MVFGWPVRDSPQPEAVITGAGAVFWNAGGLLAGVGTPREVWITHVDGPDVTGIRGVAAAAVLDLPMGMRGGLGYWHLGVGDIPRTTTTPDHEPGYLHLSEDVAVLSLAREVGFSSGSRVPFGLGGSLRFQRATLGPEARSRVEGEAGIHLRPRLPLSPRLGIALQGLGREADLLAGLEVTVPPLAAGRLPLRLAYGLQTRQGPGPLEHRFSVLGSWADQVHAGLGLTRGAREDGWSLLWMAGFEVGRYSLGVLRESLAHGFGPVHFYRAAVRFP